MKPITEMTDAELYEYDDKAWHERRLCGTTEPVTRGKCRHEAD